MKLQDERIGKESIVIEVTQAGRFTATYNDAEYWADTRQALIEQLKKAVKKADGQGVFDVTVLGLVRSTVRQGFVSGNEPFTSGIGTVDAKLRSKHEKNWNTYLLITDGLEFSDAKGKEIKFQISGSRNGLICRRLTTGENLEYLNLASALKDAQAALGAFEQRMKLDPDEALRGARRPTVTDED